ncbi:DUF2249 domain-containing protein [Uliginosibacterium sediminicola]|jgi:uncharacterized protein (DUF2249 family)|uniref:DUF2249 domain-containing protein n=1 Tax=Uliginosibacterium sediminicola TaxID=2024550 RepID=A0ABU9YT36_9RHOO
MSTDAAVTLDVRAIAPRFRHPLIFGIFDKLPPGQALLLTNDHDPKPLYYQFQAESNGAFSWDYLEEGPERWQVRIGKAGELSQADRESRCCGGH